MIPGSGPCPTEPEVIPGGGPRPTEPETDPGSDRRPTEQAGKQQAGVTPGFIGKVESDLDNKDWRVGMCGGNGDIDMLLGWKRPKPDWMVWIESSSASSHDAVPGISDFYSRDAIKDRFNNVYSSLKASILITKAGGRDDVHNQKSLVRELLHSLRLLHAGEKNVECTNGNGAVGVSIELAGCYVN